MDDHQDIINNLSPLDAHVILRQLAARDEKLAGEIAALGRANLSDVDVDEVARALRHKLESLEPEDVWERACGAQGALDKTGVRFRHLLKRRCRNGHQC